MSAAQQFKIGDRGQESEGAAPTAAAAPARVDVLAVLDRFTGTILPAKLWDGANPYCNQPGREGSDYSNDLGTLCAARAQVAELIEAASDPVLRAAPDDRNWRERGAAFARLDAALSTNEGGR